MRNRARAKRKPYPRTISDEEWSFVAPYLTLCREDAPQRRHQLRDVYNALRWMVRAGAPWRYLPTEFPPWEIVYQQTQRWVAAGCFEALVHDLRALLRVTEGRAPTPSAVVLDGRTLQSTPESGARAGYDGAKRRKGSKVHMAVDTLGHLLALRVTAADEQERAQVGALANDVQVVTGETVTLAYADQGYTGATPADAALARHPAAGREALGTEAWVRIATAALGGRAQLRMDRPFSPPHPRLRTAACHSRGPALYRICLHSAAARGHDLRKFITRSSGERASGPRLR